MATVLLSAAGSAIGSALLPAGLSVFGVALTGAAIGGAAGTLAGTFADAAIFGRKVKYAGPRLSDLQVQTSSEGAPVPRVWGRARLAGQIVWAARFKESQVEEEQGGKGLGGGATATSYRYTASFAVGLCEGVIARIGRIWADGKPLDRTGLTIRVYDGGETQTPDAVIEAVEGAGNAPAFRGLAYVVFEDLPLEKFGNRVPQLQFEVFRRPQGAGLEDRIKAVNIIPGTGEFAYASDRVLRVTGPGTTVPENGVNASGRPDFAEALDQLAADLPMAKSVLLTVTWFGTDLRCGVCEIKPGVEAAVKTTAPVAWSAGGVDRAGAHLISSGPGGPNYGGTPADASVLQAIASLKARGIKVFLYPFVLMDIPAGSGRPNPYAPAAEQPAFPWRGRITCHPAAGVAGTPDKTAAAASQVSAFFGSAAPGDFAAAGGAVVYTGPAEWSYRRFILHLAKLSTVAGGVDGFVIGSEMRGLTTVRSSASAFPAVTAMKALAADVRAVLGAGPKLTYAADWTEYSGHQPADGSGDAFFHLDPLWSDANIDAVGIDFYAPLSDWRDGGAHLDALAGVPSVYDRPYLRSRVEGGEAYDWYYADQSARTSQTRAAITDGAYGEPWVFRPKDIRNWWLNAHYDRPAGVRSGSPTAWVPQSKPVWLTEFGCPAVDKGPNQPNLFYDPKSSESGVPYFSSGARDDAAQRAYLDAVIAHWDPANGNNPLSTVYSGRMIDPERMFVWAWDARPYPDFPLRESVWRDGPNWEKGHWLNGRMGLVPVASAAEELCAAAGLPGIDASGVEALAAGYVVGETQSARASLEPLLTAFGLDALESGGIIRLRSKGQAPVLTVGAEQLALSEEGGARYALERAQDADLPAAVRVGFLDAHADYRAGSAEARKPGPAGGRVAQSSLDLVMEARDAQAVAERILLQAQAGRERARFALPPSALALEPGDAIAWTASGQTRTLAILSATDAGAREIEAESREPSLYAARSGEPRIRTERPAAAPGTVLVHFLDVPLLTGSETPHAPRVAAFANPWPGGVTILKSNGGAFSPVATAGGPAIAGELTAPLYRGPEGRWDRGNSVYVKLYGGALAARTVEDVLAGANVCAIRNAQGGWEILQFADAELTGPGAYRLSRLLRGQAGTEGEMRDPVAAAAPFVLLSGVVRTLDVPLADRGRTLTWRYGPAGVAADDPRFAETAFAVTAVGLRPLSPAHLRGWRDGAGDIQLRWTRRTRIGGDGWDGGDVPLSEAAETYRVEILDGATVKRTVTAAAPQAVYTAAQQIADFGSASFSPLDLRVAQVSDVFGAGAYRTERVYV